MNSTVKSARIQGNETGFRIAPHNQEAEQGLLGVLLVSNRALDKVIDFLRPEHFFLEVHGRIYKAIVTLVDQGKTASPVTLKEYFKDDGALKHVGGSEYLADLAASVISVINAYDYGQTIYSRYLRRELIALGEDIVNASYDYSLDKTEQKTIEQAEARLFALGETGANQNQISSFNSVLQEALKMAEAAYQSDGAVIGVPTGFTELDNILGGLQKTDLVILAGRPSMGKTALATSIAFNAAEVSMNTSGERGARVGLFSLEMGQTQIATRLISSLARVSSDRIRKGQIDKEEFKELVASSSKYSSLPLFIDDTTTLSISSLRTRARRLKRNNNIDLLIVDYLQLLEGSITRQSGSNRVQEVAEITRGLKGIAKDLNIPVLALSQLSRQVEQREDKHPLLSDLRDSGSIEQDADVVMFVYRDEYYLSREKPADEDKQTEWQEKLNRCKDTTEILIAKQRNGPIGTIELSFDPNFASFSDK